MSLLSGFLVVCYLVADKLPVFLASIILTLFSLVSALLIFRIYLNGNTSSEILSLMREQHEAGTMNIPWMASDVSWSAKVVAILEILVTLGGYVGSIAFFFYRRKHPGDAE